MILGEIVFQIFHFFEYCLFCLCMKWRRSKKELICQNSNIPQISCFSVLFVVYHFRCNILDCPTKSFHHFLLLLFLTILIHIVTLFPIEFICPPKITNLDPAILINQQILSLKIPMHNPFAMHFPHPPQHFPYNSLTLLFRAFEFCCQIARMVIFH